MPYDPQNPTGSTGSPYDTLRSRAVQQNSVQRNQGLEALQRRYAAMGNLNSGSNIEQINNLNRQSGEDLQNELGQINLGEQEGANQRNFQREMQQGGQAFQAKQADIQRQFQGEQAGLQRGLQEKLANMENATKARQLDLEFQNSDLERQAMLFNQDMAGWQREHSGGLLGGGGFLGTGLGGSQGITGIFNKGGGIF